MDEKMGEERMKDGRQKRRKGFYLVPLIIKGVLLFIYLLLFI